MTTGNGFRIRVFGHPLHPMLVHLPLGLLFVSVLWDALGWIRGEALWSALSFWCITVGLVTALPAAAAGLTEIGGLDERAMQICIRHISLVLTAILLFGASVVMRGGGTALPPPAAVCFSVLGAAVLAAGGWYGGELVYGSGGRKGSILEVGSAEKQQGSKQAAAGDATTREHR
jgi:uncharacterized membrane protein